MNFHLRSGFTVLVLLTVLVTPSFSGLRDKGLKVQTIEVGGLAVRNSVALAERGRFAFVAPYNPTTIGVDEPITKENVGKLNNNQVEVFDLLNLDQPQTISLGGCYFVEKLSFYPATGLVVCQGTDFVDRDGAIGSEFLPVKVIVYFWLSLNDDKSKVSQPVPIRIPIPNGDSTTLEGQTGLAVVGDQLLFTNDENLFTCNLRDGRLGVYPMTSDPGSKGTLEIVGVHEKPGIVAIANQVAVETSEGAAHNPGTDLRFFRVEDNGSISLIRTFSLGKGSCLVPDSNLAFLDDSDGNPLAGYCIDNLGNLREYPLDADGTDQVVVQFPGLAQDPNIAYSALCPRVLQLLDRFIVVSRAGTVSIRRPAFGKPSGSAGIRRPAFITSEERMGVSIARLPKSKRVGLMSKTGGVRITADLSAALGDDVSALIARPGDNPGDPIKDLLILLKQGNVFSLTLSTLEDSTSLMYLGYLGGGDVVAGANDGDQLAAIRASASGVNADSGTVASGELLIAKIRSDGRNAGSTVALRAAQVVSSSPTKSVAPSIRRPCNLGR